MRGGSGGGVCEGGSVVLKIAGIVRGSLDTRIQKMGSLARQAFPILRITKRARERERGCTHK